MKNTELAAGVVLAGLSEEEAAVKAVKAKMDALDARYVYLRAQAMVYDRVTGELVKEHPFTVVEPMGKAWLSPKHKTPSVLGVCFEPTQPAGCVLNGLLNTWTGLPLKPVPGSLPGFLALLEHLVPDDDDREYLRNMLAWRYQHLGDTRGCCAVILKGVPGTGKGTLGQYLQRLYGPYFIEIDHARLQSDFNKWLKQKLVIFANEITEETFREKASMTQRLKGYVCGDAVQINQKGVDEYEIANHSTWLFASNAISPLLIEISDRRYSIIATTICPLSAVCSCLITTVSPSKIPSSTILSPTTLSA